MGVVNMLWSRLRGERRVESVIVRPLAGMFKAKTSRDAICKGKKW